MSLDSPSPPTAQAVRPVVTLFEQSGAGADYVGRRVAQALGLPYHQQAFSSAEIEHAGRGGSPADDDTQQNAVLALVFSVMGGAYGGFDGRDVPTTQRQRYELVAENNSQVHRFADEGGVIVGRNAAVILADRPSTVHVLLTAAEEDRVRRAAAGTGLPPERAAERLRREDQVRSDMSLTLYGWDPRLPDRYDLVFNTSRIDLDHVVDAILAAVRGAHA